MTDMLAAVLAYIGKGWSPVPVPYKKKGPIIDAWQGLRIGESDAPRYFNGAQQNVGVILGKASGGLTDLDLDCPEAIAAAGYILPASALFGRLSKPASHWLYRTNLCETQDRAAIKFMGSDKHGLLEIRMGAGGFAAQTVFPPSTHVSGEPIEWVDGGPGKIADVDGDELVRRARRLAAAAELARNYPKAGDRHDAAFVLGGFLAGCGFSPSAATTFVEAVGVASLQPGDKRRDMGRTARDGANAARGAGFPALAETFGQATAKKVADWLGYTEAIERQRVGEPTAPRERATIELRVGETERAVDELEGLLIASKRGLYQRGGLIVAAGFDKMQTWDGKTIEVQIIEERGDYALLEDAEAVAKFVRFDAEGKARPAPPPMALIRTLKDRKQRLRLPVLVGIVNCPSISADGQLLDRPGYDPKTGVLYDPLGVIFPSVPSLPDRAHGPDRARTHPETAGDLRLRREGRQGRRAVADLHRHRPSRTAARSAARLRRASGRKRQVDAGRYRLDPRHRPRGGRHRARREPRGSREAAGRDLDARQSDHRCGQLRAAARRRAAQSGPDPATGRTAHPRLFKNDRRADDGGAHRHWQQSDHQGRPDPALGRRSAGSQGARSPS